MKKPVIFVLIAIFLVASGCAKTTTNQTIVKADYYPRCHEPLAYLHERTQGSTAKSIAGGAIKGGVISGIAGAIIGAIVGGSIRPGAVLASVGVGAAIGGIGGAAQHSTINTKEDNKHLAEYLEQIDGNIEGMDIVKAAATVSNQCYGKEFDLLLDNLKDMPQDAAKKRLEEILAGRAESAQLLGIPANNFILEERFAAAEKKVYSISK